MGVRLGNGNWAVKTSKLLAYNDASGMFFNKEFDFTRATTATRVNKSGLIESVASNLPRIDFTNDTRGYLLLEPASTNLDVNSENLSTGWSAASGATQQVEAGVTPFGISGSVKRVTGATNNPPAWDDNANSLKKQYTVTATDPASTFTFSVYVKSAPPDPSFNFPMGSTTVNIQLRNNTAGPAVTTGAISLTSDWQRVSVTLAVTTTTTRIGVVIAGTNGEILLSGAQLEAKEFATSLIPTSGSTVTRNAEVCNSSGAAQDFNTTEGVLYAEIAALANDGTTRALSLSSGSSSNRVFINYGSGTDRLSCFGSTGSATQFSMGGDTDATGFTKVALKYKLNDIALFINGSKVGTDTSATLPSANTFTSLQLDSGAGASDFYGKVREVRTYRTALTDSELTALTT